MRVACNRGLGLTFCTLDRILYLTLIEDWYWRAKEKFEFTKQVVLNGVCEIRGILVVGVADFIEGSPVS